MRLRPSALSTMGDALWSPAGDVGPTRGRAFGTYLGVAIAIAFLLVLRRPDGITNPQFWAEDGCVFFQENLKLGCWRALHGLFRGFPYLGQKLMACAATPVPTTHVPLTYNVAAYLIAAASLASFTLPGFRHVVRSDALRGVFAAAVAALPQADELVGSLTNIGWFLGIWLVLLTVMRLPRSPMRLTGLAGAGLLATFSAPLAIVTAPLWLARAIHAARGRRLREACFATVALAGVLALLVYAGDLGRGPARAPSLARPLVETVSLLVLAHAALGPATVLSLVTRLGFAVVYVVALAILVVLAAIAWRGRWRSVPVFAFAAYGIVTSSALALVGRPDLAGMAPSLGILFAWLPLFSRRYHLLAVGLVYLAFLAGVDRLAGARSRRVATCAVLAWLVATEAPTFVLPPFLDLRWPFYAADLDRKLAERSLEPLVIPINPDPVAYAFFVGLDVRVMAPEVRIPPVTSLGPVLRTTRYEQTFLAQCANLSEVDLFLGKSGRPAEQTFALALREEATGRVVVGVRRPASEIVAGIERPVSEAKKIARRARATLPAPVARALRAFHPVHPLYFPPLGESEGKRYVLTVTGSSADPDDALVLYGSAENTYPAGVGRLNGSPLAGDIAFRYGCTRP